MLDFWDAASADSEDETSPSGAAPVHRSASPADAHIPRALPADCDLGALWDFDHPDQTERKFRQILLQFREDDLAFLELLTQIARAQELQRKVAQAHRMLHQMERRLEEPPSRPEVRYLLERGRVYNSSGKPRVARPWFRQASKLAEHWKEDFYTVDALHMLAIVAAADQSLALNLQAIHLAESSLQERARGWLGSLSNNTGRSYHAMGDYPSAVGALSESRVLAPLQRSGARDPDRRLVWGAGLTFPGSN